MRMNRREFIVLGVAGMAVGCGKESSSAAAPPPATASSSQPAAAAQTKLDIKFVGLCGMAVTGTPSKLDVLFVDGVQTLGAGHEHFPRLYAPTASIATGSTPATGTDPKDPSMSYWDLKDHRLRLTSGATTGVTRWTGHRNPANKKPSTAAEQEDISWVAGMANIAAAGSGKINPQCLADDPRPGKVAGSARFTSGYVKSRFKPPYHQVIFQITSPGVTTPYEQALGQLLLSDTLASGPVSFTLDPFGGGTSRQIVLNPTGANLDVTIKNLPDTVSCTSTSDVQTLSHFAAFYQLLATASSSAPVPVCAPPCQLTCDPQEDEPIYCPPTEYQG